MPKVKRRGFRMREQVARFENPFAMLMLTPENFLAELPTAEDRAEFRETYPEHFYDLFGFEADESDAWPASSHHGELFRRDDFLAFMEAHRPRVPFDPPDLSGIAYQDRARTIERARGEWWIVNGLPMTDTERAWAEQHRGAVCRG